MLYPTCPPHAPIATPEYDTAGVECFGWNNYGQIGIDSTTNKGSPTGTVINLATALAGNPHPSPMPAPYVRSYCCLLLWLREF